MFLAQLFGVDMTLGQEALVVTIAVASAIGAPATPGVGIVILATLLGSVGVPISGIALILGVDRLLDMSRTAINVAGDLLACVVMDRRVGGPTSAPEQLDLRRDHEARRASTGEDVRVDPESISPGPPATPDTPGGQRSEPCAFLTRSTAWTGR